MDNAFLTRIFQFIFLFFDENRIIIRLIRVSTILIMFKTVLIIFLIPIVRFAYLLISNLIKVLRPLPDLQKMYGRQTAESWAVVTGATDGIGLGFCEQLARLGWNVMLVSRNEKKLQQRIEELKQIKSITTKASQFKYIVFDFTNAFDLAKITPVIDQLSTLDIGILVNNVGTGDLSKHHEMPAQQILDTISINCTTIALLTSKLIPVILKRSPLRSGIINLSSAAGQIALPYFGLYSATKAFDHYLSQSLAAEYQGRIDILSVKPLFVESPLSRKKKGFNIPDRRQCARDCLKELACGEHQTYGYTGHRIAGFIEQTAISFIPQRVVRWLTKRQVSKELEKYQNSRKNAKSD